MKKTFEVNGKKYTAKEFDFDLMCELESAGVETQNMFKQPLKLYRGYLAVCANTDVKTASNEIQAHIVAGKSLDDITKVITDMMNESSFFRGLQNQQTEME